MHKRLPLAIEGEVRNTSYIMVYPPNVESLMQPVDVWTKCGRRGRIKEPVGTHGKLPHTRTSIEIPSTCDCCLLTIL